MFPAGGGGGEDGCGVTSDAGSDTGVAATYQVMFLTGWSPSRNQPKPAARGSANISFHEFAEAMAAAGGDVGAAGGDEESSGSGSDGDEGGGGTKKQ
jgi:hypothetical protein